MGERFNSWRQRWTELEDALRGGMMRKRGKGGERKTPRFEISEPAAISDVEAVEAKLPRAFPASVKKVLTGFAGRVDFGWSTPQNFEFRNEFHQCFGGECRWDLDDFPRLWKEYQNWSDSCFTGTNTDMFPDKESYPRQIEYDKVWHNRFPVLEVGNGDMIGIDLASSTSEHVVYLSHDDGEGHGYRLADDFVDFIDRLTDLGFVGMEDWQLMPFLNDSQSGLDVHGVAAIRWRALLGLPRLA